MFRRTTVPAIVAVALIGVLWGCGAAATPIPSAAAPSQAPSAAPSAAESTAASEAPSTASGQASPGFSLPSEAKDLEALLPSTVCGVAATKVSMNGQSFLSGSGSEFAGALSALGKSPSDVSVAVAAAAGGCSAVAIRIAGIDQNTLQSAMLAAAQKGSGTAPTQSSIGGKTVYVAPDSSGKKSYVYFKGDTMFIAEADTDANAAAIVQAFPS
jgi:hypothetical protein